MPPTRIEFFGVRGQSGIAGTQIRIHPTSWSLRKQGRVRTLSDLRRKGARSLNRFGIREAFGQFDISATKGNKS